MNENLMSRLCDRFVGANHPPTLGGEGGTLACFYLLSFIFPARPAGGFLVSLPFNRRRRFGTNIIHHPVYSPDFVDDLIGYPRKEVIGKL